MCNDALFLSLKTNSIGVKDESKRVLTNRKAIPFYRLKTSICRFCLCERNDVIPLKLTASHSKRVLNAYVNRKRLIRLIS